jgi:hypothetical protein
VRTVTGGRMGYSLGQAAKAAGRSKTTIHRAISSGRLSATRNESGGYSIDPAELARVFQEDRSGNSTVESTITGSWDRFGAERLAAERDRFEALAEERAATIRDLRAGLDDLRTRLDASEAERRQLSERLGGLLPAPAKTELRIPWWRRWFR